MGIANWLERREIMNIDARAEFERSLYEKQRQRKIIMDDIEGKQRALQTLCS
jgi:hypothetical protein